MNFGKLLGAVLRFWLQMWRGLNLKIVVEYRVTRVSGDFQERLIG